MTRIAIALSAALTSVGCTPRDPCAPFSGTGHETVTHAGTASGGRFRRWSDLEHLQKLAGSNPPAASALVDRMLAAPPRCFGATEREQEVHRTSLLAVAGSLPLEGSRKWLFEAAARGSESSASSL